MKGNKNKIKILFVISTLDSIMELLNYLSTKYQIYVIYVFKTYLKNSDFNNNIYYYKIKAPEKMNRFVNINLLEYFYIIPILIRILKQTIKIIIENDIDIINAHWAIPSGCISALSIIIVNTLKLSRKKTTLITTIRGSDLKIYIKNNFFKYFINYALHNSSKIICVSEDIKNILIKMGFSESILFYLPPGINMNKFYPRNKIKCRTKLNIKLNNIILLYVGNLMRIKNVDFIIKKFGNNDENSIIKLLIIGDGPERKYLFDLTQKNKYKNIIFIGNIHQDKIPTYMSASNALILLSSSEGLPISVQEAMACGLPVIVSNVGGLNSIIKNKYNGFIIENEMQIDEIINQLKIDANKFNIIGENAYKYAKNYLSHDTIYKKYEKILLR